MAGNKIDAMAVNSAPAGTELLFASSSGTPKSMTTAVLKQYVIDSIEALSSIASVTGSDSIFALQGGVMAPTDIDVVAQHAIDKMWGKAAETVADAADLIVIKDGGTTEKTLTLTLLADYVLSAIEARLINLADVADGAGTIQTTDYMLVTQGTTGKRIQISNLSTLIYASLAAHVTGKTGTVTVTGTDVLYFVRGGTADKMTAAELATYVATTAALSGTGTTNWLAQWSSSTALQAGFTVIASTAGFTVGSDTAIPTTKAVRDEMDMVIYDSTDIGAALVGTDTILVDDGAAGTTQRKSALSRVWTYILALIVAVTDVSTYGWVLDQDTMSGDDATKVPTQQSVKAYVDAHAPIHSTATAVVATSDGLTTGIIPSTAVVVTTTVASDANDIVTLPAPVVGMKIRVYVGGTGHEVRTVAASNVTINNVDSDGTNELALAANTYVTFECVSATAWIAHGFDNVGADLAALVPDAA